MQVRVDLPTRVVDLIYSHWLGSAGPMGPEDAHEVQWLLATAVGDELMEVGHRQVTKPATERARPGDAGRKLLASRPRPSDVVLGRVDLDEAAEGQT